MAQSHKKTANTQEFHPAGSEQRSSQHHRVNSFPHQKIHEVQTGEDYDQVRQVSERDRVFYRSNIDDWQG